MHGDDQRYSLERCQAVSGAGRRFQAGGAPPGGRRPRRRLDARGQGLVEFSLTLLFLSVLLLGLLDLGRAYFTYLALKDAAAEGAYFGSAFPQCVNDGIINISSPACADPNTIPYRVRNSAPRGGLVDWTDPSSAQVVVDLPCGNANPCLKAGEVLTVTVSYRYQLLTPFIGIIANSQTLTLTARSTAVIVRVPDCSRVASSCT
jgi:Flp pilus assembly protein TadG